MKATITQNRQSEDDEEEEEWKKNMQLYCEQSKLMKMKMSPTEMATNGIGCQIILDDAEVFLKQIEDNYDARASYKVIWSANI